MRTAGFPEPAGQHAIIRNGDEPVTEADLLYLYDDVVWAQGAPHHRPWVAKRYQGLRQRLQSRGYRLVEVWPERMDEGLRDLAIRIGRDDLLPRLSPTA
jgi:deoxyribodipyrimidine photolyase